MKPLSRKKRIASLVILVLIFIFLAPALWLYSSGYRLDDALSLVKTGGIYIHSDLANARVYIDGEFIEDNGVILRNTLVQNLRPNENYKVRVEKDGYYTWEKELYVRPNLVTEGKILMLEIEPNIREIEQFLVTETEGRDGKVATTTVANPEYLELLESFSEKEGQFDVKVATTTIVQTRTGPVASSTFVTEIQFPNFIEDLEIEDLDKKDLVKESGKNLAWLEGGNVTVYWAGDEDAVPFYYCMEECKERNIISLGDDIIKYDFYPDRNDVILALTKNGLFAIEIDDRSNQNIQPVMESKNLNFKIIDGSIYIFNSKTFFEI